VAEKERERERDEGWDDMGWDEHWAWGFLKLILIHFSHIT